MIFFSPMIWATKTLHLSAPASVSNFRIYCQKAGPPVHLNTTVTTAMCTCVAGRTCNSSARSPTRMNSRSLVTQFGFKTWKRNGFFWGQKEAVSQVLRQMFL